MLWRTILTLLVSAAFLFLAVRNFDPDQFWAASHGVALFWVLPALAAYLLSFLFRALRWRLMLRPIKPISHRALFMYIVLGYMANDTLPARLGELVRAYVTGKREGISRSSVFASVLLERVFDGLTMVLILAGLLLFGAGIGGDLIRLVALGGAGLFLGALAFLVALAFRPRAVLWLASYLARLLPARAGDLMTHILNRFMGGLALLHRPGDFALAGFLSLGVWGSEALVYWAYVRGFGFDVPFTASLLAMSVANLAMLIPSSPAGIGVFQYAVQRSLVLFGVGGSAALSFSFAVHFTHILPIILLGLIFMARLGLSMREIRGVRLSEEGDS